MTADMDSSHAADSPAAGRSSAQAAECGDCCTPRNCAATEPAAGGAHEGSPTAHGAAAVPPSAPAGPPLLQAADKPMLVTAVTGAIAAAPSQQPPGCGSQQEPLQQLQRTPLAEMQTPAVKPPLAPTSGGGSGGRKRKSTTPASAGQPRTGRSRRSSAASPQALAVPQAAEPGTARVTRERTSAPIPLLWTETSPAR